MTSPLLISVCAGFASAVLFLSSATATLLAKMLILVVALPGFIAGLGWGRLAALISGASATVIIAAIAGPVAGLSYLATLGLPIAFLVYLALLSRSSPGAEKEGDAGILEWYPPGPIVVWSTLLAGLFVSLSALALGFDAESYRNAAKSYFDTAIFSHLPADAVSDLDREKLEPLLDTLVTRLPAALAMAWLGIMLTNLWAAAKIVETSGRAIRPCPPIADMTYPRQFPLGFMGALLLIFVPGMVGILAMGFAGAFLFAYVLMGLTVLHVLVRRSAFPNLLLVILYLAMLLMEWVTLFVAVVGLGEPVFKLRERAMGGPRPPSTPNNKSGG